MIRPWSSRTFSLQSTAIRTRALQPSPDNRPQAPSHVSRSGATTTNGLTTTHYHHAVDHFANNTTSSIMLFRWSSTRQFLTTPATLPFSPVPPCTRIVASVDKRRFLTSKTRLALLAAASSPFDPDKKPAPKSPFAGGGYPGQNTNTIPTHHSNNQPRRRRKEFVPRKAAVELTERARLFFQKLLSNPPRAEIIGILLNYDQSTTGEPRMVFSFSFVTAQDLERLSLAHNGSAPPEGVSLEVVEEEVPIAIRGGGGDGEGTDEHAFKSSTRIVPKSPAASKDDGLPKLYVSGNAFLKVLGATVDVDPKGDLTPILFDKQGNRMDPNA